MLTLGLWGVPTSAQLRARLLPGDGLIVAVGSPHREFVGDAVLGSRYRGFSTDEIAAMPAGFEFDHGLTLSRARIWSTVARSQRSGRASWRPTPTLMPCS